ncbi:MAG: hypothetical protein Q8N99_07830 [Nanoarchaeota archaeon]|nr:hypothetical protein [Nanoarchaeota archaeon]
MKNNIAIRGYTEKRNKKQRRQFPEKEIPKLHDRILIFDTETTSDEFQNLKFGSFIVVDNNVIQLRGIFYNPQNINSNEKNIIEGVAKIKEISLFTLNEFVNEIFYPEVLGIKTLCINFNLPFDLSRLAFHYGDGRKHHHGWFSCQISEDTRLPRIKIKHIDSAMSFMQFSSTYFKGRKGNRFKGYFLDLKTLSYVFSNKKDISLLGAGKFFGCKCLKEEVKTHGVITPEYVEYNLKDVDSTYDLYLRILDHYHMYGIDAPITKIYSSAALAKYALRQLGIKPLSRISSNIDSKLKGNLMAAYFGGRCEVKRRKTPTEVSVLDFKSMYPSLTILMNLWELICAKEIIRADVTEEIRDLLKNIRPEDLNNKEIWKRFNVLVELIPEEDVLPLRAVYKDKSSIYNVGINYFTHKDKFYYALPDVIATVLYTGKVPKITKATRFIPRGKQDTLKKARILGIDIDPSKDNFIKVLVDQRQIFKDKCSLLKLERGCQEYKQYDGIQRALKILVNSITYGIFIEMLPQEEKSNIKVYSVNEFFTKQKLEEEGRFFNPLIAVMQVAGARLLLAMTENLLKNKKSQHAYMDTDSCYIPSEYAQEIQDFFKPLNPYSSNTDFFKIDKAKMLFYGISAKRYVLYKLIGGKIYINPDPEEGEYKLHGLGHLLNPYKQGINWQKQIWQDILELHYGHITENDIQEKYSQFYALSKFTVSTPNLAKRFNPYNNSKQLSEQIKPFNFILIGQGNFKDIKPITAYRKENSQGAVHKPFIDYKTGRILKGVHYWKNLADVIVKYANHPESKFANGNEEGLMERRHVTHGEIRVVGKETKNIEEQPLEVEDVTEYISKSENKKKILNMGIKEARDKKVSKSTLWEMQKRLKKNTKKFNWNTKAVKKLLS